MATGVADAGVKGPCPSLGIFADRTSSFSVPSELHRCFALTTPERISFDDQLSLCLSGGFPRCPWFRRAAGPTADGASPPGPPREGPEIRPVETVPGPETASRRPPGVRRPGVLSALVALLRVFGFVVLRLQAAAPPSAVSRPSAGEAATPASATPDAASFGVLFSDDFAGGQRGWPSDQQSVAWYTDGSYHLLAREPARFVAIRAPLARPLRDVIVTARFRKAGGPPGGGYGLIVRADDSSRLDGFDQGGRYFVFEVGDKGEFGIWRRDRDRWVDLVPWTPSTAVQPGTGTNELAVQAIGPKLTFQVNGVTVASREDGALVEGAVGIFVGGDLNEVVLDRFAVRGPA